MNTYILCLQDGSTSYYLSQAQGDEIQEMIERRGLEATIETYANCRILSSIYINYGMGEQLIADDKLYSMYCVEAEEEAYQKHKDDVMGSDLMQVVRAVYHRCYVIEITQDDIYDMEWEELDSSVYDVVKVGEEAMRGFMKNIIYNDKYNIRSGCEQHIYKKMEQYAEKNNLSLTERQKQHLFETRGWVSRIDLGRWVGRGKYDYEKHQK